MKRTGVLQEIRMMRFEELYERQRQRRLSQEEAAEILGVDVRTFRRWSRRYEEDGLQGLIDQRLGKRSARCAPVDQVLKVEALYRDRYAGFNVRHFHEKLIECHNMSWCYTWTKRVLQQAGLVKRAARRGAHRKRRERRPLPGMLLFQDGSRYEWLPGIEADLIATMDDADNRLYSAFLAEEEGTMSSFQGVGGVIEADGLFASLYVDRASHYFFTPQAGGKVDSQQLTQFGRAMRQLGIELIPSYSPQARGRMERLFKTLQDRLPKEFALADVRTIEQANRFLKRRYLPAHNRRFSVAPAEAGSAFVPWIGTHLWDILCVQEERVVGNDNTVRYQNRVLQIPEDAHRRHYVKAKVRVHEYPNGMLAVFHGPRCLARYQANGKPMELRVKRAA